MKGVFDALHLMDREVGHHDEITRLELGSQEIFEEEPTKVIVLIACRVTIVVTTPEHRIAAVIVWARQ